ncbi:hypothetical protein [Sphingosinithalassobacter portus]|uniref:hypothetical protein n=1 Tax=Stakelama portus TaxID=2676234 RepID=UPI000D6DFCCF|nr:hypothetical protein [Sphingosinithalassobacter portus]
MVRRTLIGIAVLVFAADAYWFLSGPLGSDGKQVEWLLYMPELESYQTAHPENFLTASERWDERLPAEAVVTDPDILEPMMRHRGRDTSPLFASLVACRPAAVQIDSRDDVVEDMPPRYIVAGSPHIRTCMQKALPAGYVAKELAE